MFDRREVFLEKAITLGLPFLSSCGIVSSTINCKAPTCFLNVSLKSRAMRTGTWVVTAFSVLNAVTQLHPNYELLTPECYSKPREDNERKFDSLKEFQLSAISFLHRHSDNTLTFALSTLMSDLPKAVPRKSIRFLKYSLFLGNKYKRLSYNCPRIIFEGLLWHFLCFLKIRRLEVYSMSDSSIQLWNTSFLGVCNVTSAL